MRPAESPRLLSFERHERIDRFDEGVKQVPSVEDGQSAPDGHEHGQYEVPRPETKHQGDGRRRECQPTERARHLQSDRLAVAPVDDDFGPRDINLSPVVLIRRQVEHTVVKGAELGIVALRNREANARDQRLLVVREVWIPGGIVGADDNPPHGHVSEDYCWNFDAEALVIDERFFMRRPVSAARGA